MSAKILRRVLVSSHVMFVGAAIGLAGVSMPAAAQHVTTSFSFGSLSGGSGDGQITRTSVKRYADVLALDEAQREVLDVLFEGYSSSYQSARQQMTGDMEEMQEEFRDTQDFMLFREQMTQIMSTFRDKSESLESQFFGDLRAVLSESQVERMPGVDRMRRRETQLSFNVSGANVDLSDVVHDIGVDMAGELVEAMQTYELDLDRMLKDNQRDPASRSRGGDVDFEEIQKSLEEAHERGLRIRDINRRHARTMATMLEDSLREQFERAVLERSFPRVYRTPYPSRLFDTAIGFSDLTDDQRSQLEVVRDGYRRDLVKANERWAGEIEKADDEGRGGHSMFSGSGGRMIMLSLGGGDEEDSPVDEARKARRELDKRAENRVRDILVEEQIAKLPKRRDDEQTGAFSPIGGSQVIIRGG